MAVLLIVINNWALLNQGMKNKFITFNVQSKKAKS